MARPTLPASAGRTDDGASDAAAADLTATPAEAPRPTASSDDTAAGPAHDDAHPQGTDPEDPEDLAGEDAASEDTAPEDASSEDTALADASLPDEAVSTAKPPAAGRRTLPRPGLIAGLLAVAVALAAGCLYVGWQWRHSAMVQQENEAAVTLAGDTITKLWSINARNSEQTVEGLLAVSTGALRSQFADNAAELRKVLTDQGATSAGTLLAAGLDTRTDNRAAVLVAVNADVRNSKGESQIRQFRLRAQLERQGDRWLVSNLEFVQ